MRDDWDNSWQDDRPAARGGVLRWAIRYSVLLIVACLGLAYAFKQAPELSEIAEAVADRKATEPAPRRQRVQAARSYDMELILQAEPGGQFITEAYVEGINVRFLVDTGASVVTLRPEDASRMGLDPFTLEYSKKYRTANGVVLGAPVTLSEVRLGDLSVEDVQATVLQSPMSISLLGMSFLRRVKSYEVQDNEMILRW